MTSQQINSKWWEICKTLICKSTNFQKLVFLGINASVMIFVLLLHRFTLFFFPENALHTKFIFLSIGCVLGGILGIGYLNRLMPRLACQKDICSQKTDLTEEKKSILDSVLASIAIVATTFLFLSFLGLLSLLTLFPKMMIHLDLIVKVFPGLLSCIAGLAYFLILHQNQKVINK